MPYPERLHVWITSDRMHSRVITAVLQGAIAGALGHDLWERAEELGYRARSAEGDAFEEAFFYAQEESRRRRAIL